MTRKVLIDTSAWIDHLRGKTDKVSLAGEDTLTELVSHPMVIAELALGGVPCNSEIMALMNDLRMLRTVSDFELLEFIQKRNMQGRGIGYVDVNLLASCILDNVELLTFDQKLNSAASSVGVKHYQSDSQSNYS